MPRCFPSRSSVPHALSLSSLSVTHRRLRSVGSFVDRRCVVCCALLARHGRVRSSSGWCGHTFRGALHENGARARAVIRLGLLLCCMHNTSTTSQPLPIHSPVTVRGLADQQPVATSQDHGHGSPAGDGAGQLVSGAGAALRVASGPHPSVDRLVFPMVPPSLGLCCPRTRTTQYKAARNAPSGIHRCCPRTVAEKRASVVGRAWGARPTAAFTSPQGSSRPSGS